MCCFFAQAPENPGKAATKGSKMVRKHKPVAKGEVVQTTLIDEVEKRGAELQWDSDDSDDDGPLLVVEATFISYPHIGRISDVRRYKLNGDETIEEIRKVD